MKKRIFTTGLAALFILGFLNSVLGAEDPRNTLIGKVMQRKTEGVQALIDKGADVNMHDKNSGVTPLVMACTHGLVDIAKLLIKNGADVNLPGKNGTTPLIAAAGRSLELVELLLEKGADPAARTQEGECAFTYSMVGAMSGRAGRLILNGGTL